MWKSVEAGERTELFSSNPKFGGNSPYYNPTLTAGSAAVAAARVTSAASRDSIKRCKHRTDAALVSLSSVTGP
jgi:hypothetical protein